MIILNGNFYFQIDPTNLYNPRRYIGLNHNRRNSTHRDDIHEVISMVYDY